MSGRNNRLKANGCIYVDPTGTASLGKPIGADTTFSRVGGSNYSHDSADGLKGALDNDAQAAGQEVKSKSGIAAHLKEDFEHTKSALNDVGGILSGKKAAAELEMGAEVATDAASKMKDLKKVGGDYLSNMGRGSKTIGGAKVAAYMVGASMLTDMLNPFDDD